MTSFPNKSTSNSRTIFEGRVQTITADPAIMIIPSQPVIAIPCDKDGNNPDYTGTETMIYIYQGGALQTGWTLAYVSGVNCAATVNNISEPRTVSIGIVSADNGYAVFTATKDSISITFQVHFAKVLQGEDGSAGPTGPAGPTGATGATGADGTGLVTVKKVISVTAATSVTKSDYGDGNLKLTYSGAHGFQLGDWVRVYQSGVYDDRRPVSEVISATEIKLDIAYDATAGAVTAYGLENFQAGISETGLQFLAFNEIIPHGAKVLEVQILCADDDSGTIQPVQWKLGTTYNGNLDDVPGNWLASAYVYQEGEVEAVDRRTSPEMNAAGAYSLYAQALPSGDNWSTDLSNYQVELFVSYINYNPTYTP